MIHESWGDNVIIQIPFVEGDVEAAFAEADHVIEDTLKIQRYSTQPIETRGYLAVWNSRNDTLTFHGACQNPHPLRWRARERARGRGGPAPRHRPARRRRVRPEDARPSGGTAHRALLARLTGRPVKWIEDRRESLLVGGREHMHRFKVGFTSDGRITALRDHFVANVGALGGGAGLGDGAS